MKINGNKATITNGTIETIYEIQANGDLIKMAEKCAGIVIWSRPNPRIYTEA